jgi:hypothetical protein
VSGLDVLEMVYYLLPSAFFADLLVLPLGLWWVRRWRRLRASH